MTVKLIGSQNVFRYHTNKNFILSENTYTMIPNSDDEFSILELFDTEDLFIRAVLCRLIEKGD